MKLALFRVWVSVQWRVFTTKAIVLYWNIVQWVFYKSQAWIAANRPEIGVVIESYGDDGSRYGGIRRRER